MFTGIIEALGKVEDIIHDNENIHFWLSCPFTSELKTDQSLAHNGVCLTVTEIKNNKYSVTAIKETLIKTNLGTLKKGDEVNLERCMKADGRFDGHIVQGHVDQTAVCTGVIEEGGSWKFNFKYDSEQKNITVEKGSITINGVSLTVVDSGTDNFSVAIIPYTFNHTTFNRIKTGSIVNLEFDIVGKYIKRMLVAK